MNKNCKRIDNYKINRIGAQRLEPQPFEYNGLLLNNRTSKPQERRRSSVFKKVKEISGLESIDQPLYGKLMFD